MSAGKRRRAPEMPDLSSLDAGQRAVVECALEGCNVFLTGGPGVGKSHTLRLMIECLHVKHDGGVHVVAPTGAAALLVGGATMHAFPGPGVPQGTVEAFEQMHLAKRLGFWRKVRVLVIDEISMVDGEFFDWYMAALPCRPQLVVCGDFMQLPPVAAAGGASLDSVADEAMYVAKALDAPSESVDSPEDWIRCARGVDPSADTVRWKSAWKSTPFGLRETQGTYAFQSVAWRRAGFRVHNLTRVYRTSDDVLIAAQRAMREGDLESDAVARLVKLTDRPLGQSDGIISTIIVPRRQSVAEINQRKLLELPEATARTFRAVDSVMPDGRGVPWLTQQLERDSFFRECPADAQVTLRLGAQVMLVRNAEDGALVNGSRGVVVGFEEDGGATAYPLVRFACGVTRVCRPVEFRKTIYGRGSCTRLQVPLSLAWAVTVHKAQGASLDRVTVDLDGTFASGQAYVAVSRARSVDGLEIRNYIPSAVRTQPLVGAFYQAVADGTVEDFLDAPGLWWGAQLARPEYARWSALFRRHPTFDGWATQDA